MRRIRACADPCAYDPPQVFFQIWEHNPGLLHKLAEQIQAASAAPAQVPEHSPELALVRSSSSQLQDHLHLGLEPTDRLSKRPFMAWRQSDASK